MCFFSPWSQVQSAGADSHWTAILVLGWGGLVGWFLVGDWAVVAVHQSALWASVRFTLCMEQNNFPLVYVTMSSATGSAGRMPPNLLPPCTQEWLNIHALQTCVAYGSPVHVSQWEEVLGQQLWACGPVLWRLVCVLQSGWKPWAGFVSPGHMPTAIRCPWHLINQLEDLGTQVLWL